jgi:hypothetical protein
VGIGGLPVPRRHAAALALFVVAVGLVAWVVSRLALPGEGTAGGRLVRVAAVAVVAYGLTFVAWPRRSRPGGGDPEAS